MRLPRTFFLPRFIVTAIGMTLAVIVAVYAARTAAVAHGIAQARELFQENKCPRGFSQLVRITHWANYHPALATRVRCAAIIGHVRLGDDDAAIVLANRVWAEAGSVPRPADLWEALYQQTAHILDPIWLKKQGGLTPDRASGYKTMHAELRLLNDAERLAYLDIRMPIRSGSTEAPRMEEEPLEPAAPVAQRPTEPVMEPADAAIEPAEAVEPEPRERVDFGAGLFAVACGASTRIYDENGKHTGEMTAGTLLSVSEIRKSNGGDVALCHRENDPDTAPPLLVRAGDLSIRTGDLTRVPPPVRDLLVRHARIESELRQQRRALAAANPHAETYKKATDDYKAFIADVKRLTTRRDAATGNDRMRFADELRAMKNQESVVRTAYENSKRQYTEWKESHGSDATSDPQVAALQTNLDEVAAELAQYDL